MTLLRSTAPMRFYYYALEPGDGTVYRFGIVNLRTNLEEGIGSFGHLCPGCGDGRDYLGILINMPGQQGYYELSIHALRKFELHHAYYVIGHMSDGFYLPTVCAVLLALEVLLDDPHALDKACENMLRWREVLEEAQGDN